MSLDTLSPNYSSQASLESSFNLPAYEETLIRGAEEGTRMRDGETNVAFHKPSEGIMSYEDMRKKKDELAKTPTPELPLTDKESVQRAGVNTVWMRNRALGIIDNVKGSDSYK